MKDIQKIKEFFSKPLEEVKTDKYGNHIEPQFKKGDKVTYLGHPAEITAINKEMDGTYSYSVFYDKGQGKTKASNLKNKGGEIKLTEASNVFNLETAVAELMKAYHLNKEKALKIINTTPQIEKIINLGYATSAPEALGKVHGGAARTFNYLGSLDKINEEYTVAGHSVTLNKGTKSDGTDWTVTFKNGKLKPLSDVLALIKPMPKGITMNEVKEETGVDMVKKRLDALGVKYEMSKTDKVRPFKVIYKPVNKSDKFYDEFEDIVDLFNLKGFVKQSMSEAKLISDYKIGDIISFKDGEDWKVIKVKDNIGKLVIKPHNEKAKEGNVSLEIDIDADYLKKNLLEVKSEDKVDTITMDIPLFLRMLEYSREDASQDMDLHDVTEKANKLGKERGILSMEDYEEIVGAAEKINEYNPDQEQLDDEDEIFVSYDDEGRPLEEANVPSNIRDFAKRKGISSLVNKVAGWAEKVGARIAGGTAIGKNYSTLVLDLDYKQQGEIRIDTDEETIELYDEPVYDFKSFQRVYIDGADNNLEEGEEEQLSFISKARAKSSLRQFLSGKRDDGMGKFDAIVYGIDSDGKKHQIKYYNHLQDYEKFALGDNPDIKEAKNTSLDSETIKQIKDDIKGFPKYQKRGYESFKKEVREKYNITPKQLEDILHGDLKENVAPNHDGKAAPYGSGYKPLEERIAKALDQINEELCPAGKAYRKRRMEAGEKSSAYLSGRAVKVCKGQMSGKKKKK
jgi:hypothetical protein